MKHDLDDERDVNLVKGDFVTDGKTFIFRLEGTPLSGVGNSPAAAFEDLVRVRGATGPLADQLRDLTRDQQDEKVRATVIRMALVGLIVFGVVGGGLFGAAAIFPRVVADTSELTVTQISRWVENMPAEKQEKISGAIAKILAFVQSKGPTSQPADHNR
jgi:hypothetical protein